MFRSLQPGNIGHIGGASRNGGFTPVPVPAVLISATVSDAEPSQVTAVFDKAITSAAYATGITIKIGGVSVTSLATATGSPSATIVFTFTETVVYGDPLTISYNSATGDYVDSDTLNVGSFTDTAVTNNVIDVPSQITSGMWSIADTGVGGTAAVTISSLPAANGATITDIEYQIGAGSWTSSGGIDDFNITGLTDGSSSAIKLRAVNSEGSGAASTAKNVTSTGLPEAMVVGDWDLADKGSAQSLTVTINSLPAAHGAAITDIEYRIASGAWTSSGGTTSFDIGSLTYGSEYSITLRAVNANGSAASASDSKSATPTAVPGAFTVGMWSIADAATSGDADVTINSLPAANGASITDIEYKVGAGSWTSSGSTTSFTITGAFTDGVSTAVLIRAANSVGSGSDSDSKSVTTSAASTAPDAFTVGMWSIADAASGGDANVTIISLPAANGATITDIEYKVGAGSWTSSAGTSDFSIAGFTDGVSTAVLIRAKNSVGSGADSDSKSVTTTAASSAMKVLFEATDYHDFTAPTATQKICLAGRMKVKSTSYAYVIGTDFDTYVRQFTNFRFKGEITASGSQAFLASVLSAGVAVNDVLSFLAWADADNYYLWVSKNGATPVTTTGANDIALGVSDTYKMPRYMNAVNGSGGLASTFEMWDYIWYGSDIPTHATSQALWDLFFDGSAVGKAITATVGGVTANVFENGNAASWPTLTGGALSDV